MSWGEEIAAELEAAAGQLARLVESLTEEQWRLPGLNHPSIRMDPEDERRPVNVIAYHTAASIPTLLARVRARAQGEATVPPPPDANEREAEAHAAVTKEEVLEILRREVAAAREALREFPEAGIARTLETRMGPLTVGEMGRRVLVGHIDLHRESIEAAIAAAGSTTA